MNKRIIKIIIALIIVILLGIMFYPKGGSQKLSGVLESSKSMTFKCYGILIKSNCMKEGILLDGCIPKDKCLGFKLDKKCYEKNKPENYEERLKYISNLTDEDLKNAEYNKLREETNEYVEVDCQS